MFEMTSEWAISFSFVWRHFILLEKGMKQVRILYPHNKKNDLTYRFWNHTLTWIDNREKKESQLSTIDGHFWFNRWLWYFRQKVIDKW